MLQGVVKKQERHRLSSEKKLVIQVSKCLKTSALMAGELFNIHPVVKPMSLTGWARFPT